MSIQCFWVSSYFELVSYHYDWLSLYQVDPFLHLVEDCKLQAIPQTKVYGSKEDESDALDSVSAFSVTESQSKESFASLIVKSLADLSDVTPHMDYLDICLYLSL